MQRLNSRQWVFVTPASSWVAEPGAGGPPNSVVAGADGRSALDFVGWGNEGIELAIKAGKACRIFVWRDSTGRDATATWAHVFDTVLPAAAASATDQDSCWDLQAAIGVPDFTIDSNGKPLWSPVAPVNQKFVKALCREPLRSEITQVAQPWDSDPEKGVERWLDAPGAVAARQVLQNILYVDPLFRGDGFTYNNAGERKAREMLIETQAYASLDGLVWIDIGLE